MHDARYFAFSFNVEREGKIVASYAQRWDRFTGDYRVSGKNREGEDIAVVMNTGGGGVDLNEWIS